MCPCVQSQSKWDCGQEKVYLLGYTPIYSQPQRETGFVLFVYAKVRVALFSFLFFLKSGSPVQGLCFQCALRWICGN